MDQQDNKIDDSREMPRIAAERVARELAQLHREQRRELLKSQTRRVKNKVDADDDLQDASLRLLAAKPSKNGPKITSRFFAAVMRRSTADRMRKILGEQKKSSSVGVPAEDQSLEETGAHHVAPRGSVSLNERVHCRTHPGEELELCDRASAAIAGLIAVASVEGVGRQLLVGPMLRDRFGHETRAIARFARVLGLDRSTVSRRMAALGDDFDRAIIGAARRFHHDAMARVFAHRLDELLASLSSIVLQGVFGPVLREGLGFESLDRVRLADVLRLDLVTLEIAIEDVRSGAADVVSLLLRGCDAAA